MNLVGLLIKLIVCPLVVVLSTLLFRNTLYYPFLYQAIIVGFVLAFAGHMLELLLLKRGTFWISTITDFIAAYLLLYLSGFVVAGARVTLAGALMTALLLTITEYFQHLWLIRTGMSRKSV